MSQELYAEACAATPAVERFFRVGPDEFENWTAFGERIAANGVLERVAKNDFPMSKGERMLCLVITAKADYGHIAARAEPDVWGSGGFWSMDQINGRVALKIIADGVWDEPA
ncbi:MAG: hypothetical protein TEF_00135 [Rhizobiales bacterium NRL2]|jgi:hypothetical protein|nr:MAG: hypothetical protein TEF_00135 [Rhizobiales bacterium NRL2]